MADPLKDPVPDSEKPLSGDDDPALETQGPDDGRTKARPGEPSETPPGRGAPPTA